MDVQSFMTGMHPGQRTIPTQQMRLFIKQQRPQGRPVAVPNVLYEPRAVAHQHPAQNQNGLSQPTQAAFVGAFQQPIHPTGLLSGQACIQNGGYPQAAGFATQYVQQVAARQGQQASGVYFASQSSNRLPDSHSTGLNGYMYSYPIQHTPFTPSTAGASNAQAFDGHIRVTSESAWHYSACQMQQNIPASAGHSSLHDFGANSASKQPIQSASPHGGVVSQLAAYNQRGPSHTSQQQQMQLHYQYQMQNPSPFLSQGDGPMMGGVPPATAAQASRAAAAGPGRSPEQVNAAAALSSSVGSSCATRTPSSSVRPTAKAQAQEADPAHRGRALTPGEDGNKLRFSSAFPPRCASKPDAAVSKPSYSRRTLSTAGARTRGTPATIQDSASPTRDNADRKVSEEARNSREPSGGKCQETLTSTSSGRTNFYGSEKTAVRGDETPLSGTAQDVATAELSSSTASRKSMRSDQKIAGSRRPPPRTCASAGTINPRNVANIGEKYKDRLASSTSMERKGSKVEQRRSLWEANGKSKSFSTPSPLPRFSSGASSSFGKSRKSQASPSAGAAASGSRLGGSRGTLSHASTKEVDISSANGGVSEDDKSQPAATPAAAQGRLLLRSRAGVPSGRGVTTRNSQKYRSDVRHHSDSSLQTSDAARAPPLRRLTRDVNKPELGKHIHGTLSRSNETATLQRSRSSEKSDVEDADLSESYARRRGYSTSHRDASSSPTSRLVSSESGSRSIAQAGTNSGTTTGRCPRSSASASLSRNNSNSGSDQLKTRTGAAKAGLWSGSANSRKPQGTTTTKSLDGSGPHEPSATMNGCVTRLGSGDSRLTGSASVSTASLESVVLPERTVQRGEENSSESRDTTPSHLRQMSAPEPTTLFSSQYSSRCVSGSGGEFSSEEEEVDAAVHQHFETNTSTILEPELGLESRKSSGTSRPQTPLLTLTRRESPAITRHQTVHDGKARVVNHSMHGVVGEDENQDQTLAAAVDNAALSEGSTTISRGARGMSSHGSASDSSQQGWELSSGQDSSGNTTPTVSEEGTPDIDPFAPSTNFAASVSGEMVAGQGGFRGDAATPSQQSALPIEAAGRLYTDRRENGGFESAAGCVQATELVSKLAVAERLVSRGSDAPSRTGNENFSTVRMHEAQAEEGMYVAQVLPKFARQTGGQLQQAPATRASGVPAWQPVPAPSGERLEEKTAKDRANTVNLTAEKGAFTPAPGQATPAETARTSASGNAHFLESLREPQNAAAASRFTSAGAFAPIQSPLLDGEGNVSAQEGIPQVRTEEQMRQQMREKLQRQMQELQHAQEHQLRVAQEHHHQQMLEQSRQRDERLRQQQAEQQYHMLQLQLYAQQQMSPNMQRVISLQPGRTLTVSGQLPSQQSAQGRPLHFSQYPRDRTQAPANAEFAGSRAGHSNLRQLSGVHQTSTPRLCLRQAISEQQLRRPSFSLSPARTVASEHEHELLAAHQQQHGEKRSELDTAMSPSPAQTAREQALVASLQQRLRAARDLDSLRALYADFQVGTPAFAAEQVQATHVDCHKNNDPFRPLHAPSTKGEPLAGLARRYLHSQSIVASRCHPVGRQEHQEFNQALWAEKYRTQQDELRRNLALYQAGRPNGLTAAGISPVTVVNSLRANEAALRASAASAAAVWCPIPGGDGAGAPPAQIMANEGARHPPMHLLNKRAAALPPLPPAGMSLAPTGESAARAALSPMSSPPAHFVRTRPLAVRPVVTVGNPATSG
ncbi:hypothetical protein BESB_081780 [Besnoitia besnoiti]|uniref:Uncharacterized protein n=1 Tax=Besnoitia besnoiti TaxID=94643 RepID=A0A2A9M4V2_BESBE|nr:hypothetical protein BESB_081780 [Besnoitia besnoiti]PFH32979.1 hypothetical protein BESB_081780 [Besnoitia besnoiti]